VKLMKYFNGGASYKSWKTSGKAYRPNPVAIFMKNVDNPWLP
jgi:hypothetical protein